MRHIDNQWVLASSNRTGATIEDSEGNVVATLHPSSTTFDPQWQSIVDVIAAAPEMVAVLKEVRYMLANHLPLGERTKWDVLMTRIDNTLAKAEPPRKVKRRMLVTVEVEVEGDADAPTDVFKSHALDFVYTGGGVGTRFMGKKVTTLGELYED